MLPVNVLVSAPREDPDVGEFFALFPDGEYLPSWYDDRIRGQLGPGEQTAAMKASSHANTPTTRHLDVLSRAILTVTDNGPDGTSKTRTSISVLGEQYEIFDALGRMGAAYDFDMSGARIHQVSVDSGKRWMLPATVGNVLLIWNSRNTRLRSLFDVERRLVATYIHESGSSEILVTRTIYGDTIPDGAAHNLREGVYQVPDQAGTTTTIDCDFKGNISTSEVQFTVEYKKIIDWSQEVELQPDKRTTHTTFDALNRAIDAVTPEKTITRHQYNQAGMLQKVYMNLHGEQPVDQPVSWTVTVADTDYNARSQMTSIIRGNGVQTLHEYDTRTFRITRITTRKVDQPGHPFQDLFYTYDLAGNCTNVRDGSQQTHFFRNNRVVPNQEYTYDPYTGSDPLVDENVPVKTAAPIQASREVTVTPASPFLAMKAPWLGTRKRSPTMRRITSRKSTMPEAMHPSRVELDSSPTTRRIIGF